MIRINDIVNIKHINGYLKGKVTKISLSNRCNKTCTNHIISMKEFKKDGIRYPHYQLVIIDEDHLKLHGNEYYEL